MIDLSKPDLFGYTLPLVAEGRHVHDSYADEKWGGENVCYIEPHTSRANGVDEERGQEEAEQIAKLFAAAHDMAKAIQDVLAHVESEEVHRVGNQCTLCHTFRKLLRDSLVRAGVA